VEDERIEMQELYCHNCGNYVQFPIDLSLNGNHVLHCPSCNHEHCRVVKDGVITGERWDDRNGQSFWISSNVTTSSSTTASTNWRVMGSWGAAMSSGSVYQWIGS